jgi:GT2 family glycosyltransferase
MAFKRSYLVKAGPFDTRLGAGTPAASGEDTDMFYRIMKLGGDILFDPELSSYHDHGRHDPQAIRMICRNYAVGGTAFLVKHVVRFDVFALKLLLWKYESFRLAARRSRMDTRFNPPMNEVKKIYVKGYFAGIRMGIANLFRKAD